MKYLKRILFLLLIALTLFSKTFFLSGNGNNECEPVDIQLCDSQEFPISETKETIYDSIADWLAKHAVHYGFISQWSLAAAYEEGTIVKQDYGKAFRLFRSLANQGDRGGEFAVGYYYAKGIFVTKNSVAAVAWLKRAARKGDSTSQMELARIFLYDSDYGLDYEAAFYWASLAAQQNDIDAKIFLAAIYEQGLGVTPDKHMAFRWWLDAAEQGSPLAAFMVGSSYEMAIGVPRDYSQAVYWYQFAANKGLTTALFRLGIAYIYGMGLDQNFPKGFEIIATAAEQDDVSAQHYLGELYLNGVVVPNNDLLAITWFQTAIDNGHVDANVSLALMYLNGRGTEQSLDIALELLNKAALQESAYAAYMLGQLYKDNLFMPRDMVMALSWLRKSAELGNINAMSSIIEIYNAKNNDVLDRGEALVLLEHMQHSEDEFTRLRWALVALEDIKDKKISKAAFEYLIDAKNREIPEAFGTLSWLFRTGLGEYFGVYKDEGKAIELAIKGTKLFDSQSFYQLGIVHEFGSVKHPIDYSKAAEMYSQSFLLGGLSSKYRLGLAFLQGKGVKQNIEHALNLIEDSAKEGLEDAYVFLGGAYEYGGYVAKNMEVAKSFYRAAANSDYIDGQYHLSQLLKQSRLEKEQEESLYWLEMAARGGHSEARFELSRYMAANSSLEKQILAVEWAKLSAEAGNPRGMSMLARLLDKGVGTLQNIRKAQSLYSQASILGDPYSHFKLGAKLYEGSQKPEDREQAIELLVMACDSGIQEACGFMLEKKQLTVMSKAAKQGDKNAQYALGLAYLRGKVVSKDPIQALKWLESAASQNHLRAQVQIAVLYGTGSGVRQNYKKAFDLFSTAAKQGFANAQFNLAYLYEKGLGVSQSFEQAKKYYLLAAQQQESNAQTNLGLMYLNGSGTAKNIDEAKKWFTLGANQGHPESMHFLADILLRFKQDTGKAKELFDTACRRGYQLSCNRTL